MLNDFFLIGFPFTVARQDYYMTRLLSSELQDAELFCDAAIAEFTVMSQHRYAYSCKGWPGPALTVSFL
jgi:hypothetical protein